MTPSHLVAVTQWVDWIVQGTGLPSAVDAAATVQTRVVMLGEKYLDTRMFCQASATHVVFECGMMNLPSTGILARLLDDWWKKNKPASKQALLPGTEGLDLDGADLPGKDRCLVEFWLRDFAADKRTRQELTISLSIMRRHAARGFRFLLAQKTDGAMLAALIAVEQHWDPDYVHSVPTAEEIEAVDAMLHPRQPDFERRAEMRSDEGIVAIPSPPPESTPAAAPTIGVSAEFSAQFVATHDGRRPGALSPERLHELRMANPALRAIAEAQAKVEAERRLTGDAFVPPLREMPPDLHGSADVDDGPGEAPERDKVAVAPTPALKSRSPALLPWHFDDAAC